MSVSELVSALTLGEAEAAAVEAVAPPPRFMVTPLHNRTASPSLDWLTLALPFVLGERLERELGLRPAYDRWVIPRGQPAPVDPDAIARIGGPSTWVWTGAIAGSREELTVELALWRVEASGQGGDHAPAVLIGERAATGPVEEVMRLAAEAALALLPSATSSPAATRATGTELAAARADGLIEPADGLIEPAKGLAEPVAQDFYAFTIFGRGLAEIWAADGGPGQVRYRLQRAARQLSRAILIEPGLAEAQRMLGEVQRALGHPDEARGRLEAALRLRPGYLAAMASRAALARDDGELERAIELTTELVQARPWDTAQQLELGEMQWARGRLEPARAAFEAVVAEAPDHLAARRRLADIYARRGDHAALLEQLEAILAGAPDDVRPRFDLAAVYLALDRVEEAETVYRGLAESARVRAPTRAQALKFLGDLARRRGDIDGAIGHYHRAATIDPGDGQPLFLIAAVELARGHDSGAQRVLRQALRFPHLAAEAHAALGAIAYRQGDYTDAVWYLRRAVQRRPHNPSDRYNLALALSALGDTGTALYEVRMGLRADPTHVGLHYLRGVVLLRQGKLKQARTWFESALRLDPGHADARHNLARIDAGGSGG
ncbi:tetratricopeptide repeat protein [Haliangium sp.]|uniref:tetratricopeptide repeat protein n=1 Tax=Haliangium sp. TaxID=2663208 RepID=UPI003D0D0726